VHLGVIAVHVWCCFSVFDTGVNNPGRGVNVAVLDVSTMQVVTALRFDTYQSLDGRLFLRSLFHYALYHYMLT